MKTMTLLDANVLFDLRPADLLSVYSGRDGRCCCGCSGTHSYYSANRAAASKDRGYAVAADEVNDRQVARVLHLVQAAAHRAEVGANNFSVVVGDRLYVLYPKQGVL